MASSDIDALFEGSGPLDQPPAASPQSGDIDKLFEGSGPLDQSAAEGAVSGIKGWAHTGAYAAQQLGQGLVSDVALPRTLGDMVGSMASYWFPETSKAISATAAANMPSAVSSLWNTLPTSDDAARYSHALGLDTLKSTGYGEEFIGSAARGIGAGLPTIPFGGEGIAANTAISAAGGMGAEVGSIVAPNSQWAPVIGALATGLTGGKAIGYLSAAADAKTAAANLAGVNERLVAARAAQDEAEASANALKATHLDEKQGGTLALRGVQDQQADALKQVEATHKELLNQTVSAGEQKISGMKDGLKTSLEYVDKAEDQAKSAVQEGVTKDKASADASLASAASQRGAQTDPDLVGEHAQGIARSFLTDTLPAAEDSVWNPLNDKMNGTPVPIDTFLSRVDQIRAKGGDLSDTISRLAPNIGQMVNKGLEKFRPGEEEQLGLPSQPPAVPNWEDVKALRTAIGKARGPQATLKGIDDQQLDSLYQAVTSDMESAAGAKGLGEEFSNANQTSSALRKFAEGPIAKLVSGPKADFAQDLAPGKLTSSLLGEAKNTGATLSALRSVPQTSPIVDNLAGHLLTKVSEDPKAWTDLAPRAKVSLVPDEAERGQIESAIATKGKAPPAFDSGPFDAQRDSIQATHDAKVEAAQNAIKQAKQAYASTIQDARSASAAALKGQRRANQDVSMRQEKESFGASQDVREKGNAISRLEQEKRDLQEAGKKQTETSILHGIEAMLSSSIGEPIARGATNLLSSLDPTGQLGFANKAIAAGFPSVWRAGKAILAEPKKFASQAGRAAVVGASKNPLSDTSRR